MINVIDVKWSWSRKREPHTLMSVWCHMERIYMLNQISLMSSRQLSRETLLTLDNTFATNTIYSSWCMLCVYILQFTIFELDIRYIYAFYDLNMHIRDFTIEAPLRGAKLINTSHIIIFYINKLLAPFKNGLNDY